MNYRASDETPILNWITSPDVINTVLPLAEGGLAGFGVALLLGLSRGLERVRQLRSPKMRLLASTAIGAVAGAITATVENQTGRSMISDAVVGAIGGAACAFGYTREYNKSTAFEGREDLPPLGDWRTQIPTQATAPETRAGTVYASAAKPGATLYITHPTGESPRGRVVVSSLNQRALYRGGTTAAN